MIKKILWVTFGVFAVTALLGLGYVERLLGLIGREEAEGITPSQLEQMQSQEDGTEDLPVYDPADIWVPEGVAAREDGRVHILLIGQDRRDSASRSLSDAMILCSFDPEEGELTMTSFLRDSYVRIPGYGNNKLNAAYPLGGMALLDKTLGENFGVPVDGNIEVDFSQFAAIIDLLGGVELSLTEAEVQHLAHEYGFQLHAGVNRLSGEEALGYARIRKLGTDFARTDRQRKVLTALIEQFRYAGIRKLTGVLKEVLGLITTDMTNGQILRYAAMLAPKLGDLEIRSQYIPAQGTYSFGDAGNIRSCIFLDFDANRAILSQTILDDD